MHRRTLISLAGAAAAGRFVRPRAGRAGPGPRITVAADGNGDVTGIQAAVDAVPAGNGTRFTIDVRPGVYAGRVVVPADKPHILLRGRGARPGQVIITDARANGTPRPDGGAWGTSGSATVTVDGAGFTAANLTVANAFDEAAHPEITGQQTGPGTVVCRPPGGPGRAARRPAPRRPGAGWTP
jgi:pectinesterase